MTTDISEIRIEYLTKSQLHELDVINRSVFNEDRIINRTDHEFMIILRACLKDITIGFKVGYGRKKGVFYSAKGGVHKDYRRLGIAEKLMDEMMHAATFLGFTEFQYDTFPNLHPGMLILGLTKDFRIIEAKYNAQYKDFQITLMKPLKRDIPPSSRSLT